MECDYINRLLDTSEIVKEKLPVLLLIICVSLYRNKIYYNILDV